MNYNDYDSNGNKKDYNFQDMFSDKKQRSRLILAFYAVIIIILIVMIRVGSTTSESNTEKEDKKPEEIQITDEKEKEINQLFSLIDTNNYEFNFTLNFEGEIYQATGKRNNDKYSFTFVKEGEHPIEFLGTKNNIKAKVNDEEQNAGFPYQYLNNYDNQLLKRIIANSSKIEDGLYAITNNKLKEISNTFKDISSDSINTIKLTIQNNMITGIEIDYTNAISELLNKEVTAIITNQYTNFNLVDDFNANFE